MASIVNRMKPVNPTMSERIVKNKIRFANEVSMKMVAERHDLEGNWHPNKHKKRGSQTGGRWPVLTAPSGQEWLASPEGLAAAVRLRTWHAMQPFCLRVFPALVQLFSLGMCHQCNP